MTNPLNPLPAPPPEKDRSGGRAGDLFEIDIAPLRSDGPDPHGEVVDRWSELLLDGRPAPETLPEVRPLPPLEFTIELDHMPSCSGWTFDFGGPFDCPGAPACEALLDGVVVQLAELEPGEVPVE
jgi:hypothetical protein